MDSTTVKTFTAGFVAGSLLSGYLGFHFGRKFNKNIAKPEFRILMASVIMVIWGTAQIFSLAFGTAVDGWLNVIMGAVAGFFFGDGVIESLNDKGKK